VVLVGRERGGAVYGLLAAIGFVVVAMAIIFAVCVSTTGAAPTHHSLGRIQLIRHERGGNDCDDSGCNDYGNHGNQRRCQGDQCRGSFSPGPFDRSPIDFSNSCISLDCSGRDKGDKKQPPDQGQKPTSLTDPRKLPTVIAQITKSGLDLGQLFATGTIKFVEDLFTALA
jgi:hypothetical protein